MSITSLLLEALGKTGLTLAAAAAILVEGMVIQVGAAVAAPVVSI
jgi:hypothetical protein